MYFHYCLVAVGAILAISLVLYFIMKKNNQVNRENIANLVVCTVLSMICAVIAPLTAKHIARELYFSIPASLAVSFVVTFGIAIIIFLLLQPAIKKWASNAADEPDMVRESLVKQLMDAPLETASAIDTADSGNGVTYNESGLATENEASATTETEDADIYRIQPEEPEQVMNIPYDNNNQEDIMKLLDKAIESKSQRDLYGAISNYEAALIMNPDDELRYLILLDLCSLYKKTNQPDSVSRILESSQCQLLDLEKKEDILRNL